MRVFTFVRVPVLLLAREKPRSLSTTSFPSIGRIPNAEHPSIAERYLRGSLDVVGVVNVASPEIVVAAA